MVAAGSSVKLNSCIYEGLHLERKNSPLPPPGTTWSRKVRSGPVTWTSNASHLPTPKINMFNIFHRVRVSVCVKYYWVNWSEM